MTGVFLSHSWQDKQFVEKLALDLAQQGFPVWFDSWRLEVGAHLTAGVRKGIHASDYLVVVLSPHTAGSTWVRDEVAWALEQENRQRRKILIPIRLGGGEVPEQVSDRLYADFTGSYSSALGKLMG